MQLDLTAAAVRQRVAALRRLRQIVVAAAAAPAALAVVVLGAPLLATGTTHVAAAPDAFDGALSARLVSPAGYWLGAIAGAAALAAAFSD